MSGRAAARSRFRPLAHEASQEANKDKGRREGEKRGRENEGTVLRVTNRDDVKTEVLK